MSTNIDLPLEISGFRPLLRFAPRVLLLIFLLMLIRASILFVPPGNVGAVFDRGKGILSNELHEGLNILIPFWQTVQLFDARIQEYTMSISPDNAAVRRDDSLDAPTADGQQVKVDATVLFRIEPGKSPLIWKTVGTNYVEKIVRPIARSQIRMVISRYTAPAIYSERRQEAETVMQQELTKLLGEKHILLDKLLLRAVYFTPEYSQAIEAKVIAEQRVKQAEFEVKEASQRAQAKIQEAKGLAEAQTLQKQTLTQEYLQLEALKKWDGKLPLVVGSGATPFINLPMPVK